MTLTAGALATPPTAHAAWSGQASGAGRSRAATLAPPTAPSTNVFCALLVILVPRVTVSWTPSASAFAGGYDIRRSTTNGGPYTFLGHVNGGSTSSFTDTTVAVNRTYYYVVVTTAGQWLSVPTAQVTATTPLVCL